jgi:hypothetical protein
MPDTAVVHYDQHFRIATFRGPGGHTQQYMSAIVAEAIARALGVPFEVRAGIV